MKEFIEKLIGRLEEREVQAYAKMDGGVTYQTYRNAIEIVNQLAEEYKGGWILFKQREMDEEELRCIGEEFGYILDCKLPEEDEEILVTYKNGTVGEDIFLRDGNECYLDSGNDFVTEAIAWMPKPAPYQTKGE